jgi:hypothetical protein
MNELEMANEPRESAVVDRMANRLVDQMANSNR